MPPKKENSRRGRSFGSALINFYSQILFQADETKFRDLRKTPLSALTARRNRSFPRRGIFGGTPLSKCRGFTFPARALPRKLGARAQKRGFACASIYFMFLQFHPYAHRGKKEKVSFFLFFAFFLKRQEFYFNPARRARGRKSAVLLAQVLF